MLMKRFKGGGYIPQHPHLQCMLITEGRWLLHISKAHTPLDFGLRWVSKLWWKFGCTTPWKIQATDVIFQTDNVGRTGLKEKA